jgi:hypothetical protein
MPEKLASRFAHDADTLCGGTRTKYAPDEHALASQPAMTADDSSRRVATILLLTREVKKNRAETAAHLSCLPSGDGNARKIA